MRLGIIRRGPAVVVGVLVVLAATLALALGPVMVRARAVAAAQRRHVRLRMGSVRLEPWGVRLHDVLGTLEGVDGVEIRAADVDVHLRWNLHYGRIVVSDAGVRLDGTEPVLRERLQAWRAGWAQPSGGTRGASDVPLLVRGLTIRWKERPEDPEPKLEATGVTIETQPQATRLGIGAARFRAGSLGIAASAATAVLRNGAVARARADAVTIEWNLPGDDDRGGGQGGAASNTGPHPIGPTPVAASPLAASARKHDRNDATPALAADEGLPWTLPDVHAIRAKTALAATFLKDRISPAADIGVDALTWKIGRPNEQIALTIGPGPLAFERTTPGFELRFSTSAAGTNAAALSLRMFLPTDGQDATFGLEGGPVSLAMLGARDGAMGLSDVRNARVSGRAQLALAEDGSALTFDAEGDSRGLSINNRRLAPDVVRGLDVELRGRGVLDAGGELRLDDFGAQLGAIQFDASGVFRQAPTHVVGALRFAIPNTTCQMLLDSVPSALLPVLQGMKVGGAFGLNGRVAFDTQRLDDLKLDYDIQDTCSVTTVPEPLAPEQFQHPFDHKIYLPDGSVGDQLTGPGSLNWTPLEQISPYMQVAVLTTEDGAFRKHHGFNRASIRASLIANLKAHRFVRGASTITMQLAKNLFLAREKTMARKLEEVVLTEYLEETFSKDELMELYLNVIEFGPAVYGITAAADYYFGRTPGELNLAECFFLASLLPSPLRYGGMRDAGEVPESWMRLLRSLLVIAHDFGRITDAELAEGQGESIVFWRSGGRPPPRPPVRGRPQLEGQSDEDLGVPASDTPDDPQ